MSERKSKSLFWGLNSRRARLRRCRALLKLLDPESPPPLVRRREFNWQYRALRERAHLYSELLDETGGAPVQPTLCALERAEAAVDLSLQYFNDVLVQKSDSEGNSGRGPDG